VGVVILSEQRWEVAGPIWRRAEELGFDHAWTYDHLAWSSLRDSPWFAAIPTLVAAATVTTTMRLGTLVASPNFRHPVPFAREIITLDDITSGRLTLGLGSGGTGWDATILGQEEWSATERSDRFGEFVTLLDLLLRQRETSHPGRYYAANEARTYPGCVQQPRVPFAIAATGRRGMHLAAEQAATWVTYGDVSHHGPPLPAAEGAEVVRRQVARLEEACAAAGRDAALIDRLVLTGTNLDGGLASPAAFRETKQAYEEAGVTDLVVHWPRPSDPYAGDPSILGHLID